MKRLIALFTVLVIAFGGVATVQLASAPPASAYSCKQLLHYLAISKHHWYYWYRRIVKAGCDR